MSYRRHSWFIVASAMIFATFGAASTPGSGQEVPSQWALDLGRLNGEIVTETDDKLRQLDNFSFHMRVRFSDFHDGDLVKLSHNWKQEGFHITLRKNQLVLGLGDGGSLTSIAAPRSTFVTDRWYSISGVKDGKQAHLIVNGREVAKGEVAPEIVDGMADLVIGTRNHSASFEVSRFSFWHDILDMDQIRSFGLGLNEIDVPEPLIDYQFSEGSGRMVSNAVGLQYQGLILGNGPNLGWTATVSEDGGHKNEPLQASTGFEFANHQALNLSGPEEAVVVDHLRLQPTNGVTLQLDLKITGLRSGVIARAESQSGTALNINYSAGRVWLDLDDGVKVERISGPADAVEPNRWIRLTFTQEKDGLASLFMNKVRVASFSVATVVDGSPLRLALGEGPSAAAFDLAAVRMWQGILPSASIMEPESGSDLDLLLQLGPWKQPAHDAVLLDESGRKHDGLLKGQRNHIWVSIGDGQQLSLKSINNKGHEAANMPRKEPPTLTTASADHSAPSVEKFDIRQGHSAIITLPQPADTVIIDDPDIARAEILTPRKIYLIAFDTGQTGFTALDQHGQIIDEKRIRVNLDVGAAVSALASIDGGQDNRFEFEGDRLTLKGAASDLSEAAALQDLSESVASRGTPVRNTTTLDGAQQVNIKVRFAEVSRQDLARLGIQWGAIVNAGIANGGSSQFFLKNPFTLAPGSILGQLSVGDVDIELLFEALEQQGALSMLAEPNLTVLNGEEAKFLAGGELPIPIPQDNGSATTVEFKPFGVSLHFRPVLLGNNRISLRIASEVSDLAFDGGVRVADLVVPALTVRRAETNLELASGQTFAVGGLFKRSTTRSLDEIPGLSSIPILGALFRSARFSRSETELVILITPHLVQPIDDPGQLVLPGQSDREPDVTPRAETGFGFIVQ